MSLLLTPARLAAIYECLRTMPPFCRMKLPPASEVKFQVVKREDYYAMHERYLHRFDKHFLTVSSAKNGHFDTVTSSVAHEMIHIHQAIARTESRKTDHNAEFKRIAARVCGYFGFDPKTF